MPHIFFNKMILNLCNDVEIYIIRRFADLLYFNNDVKPLILTFKEMRKSLI